MNSQSEIGSYMDGLCASIRKLIPERKFKECENLLSEAMRKYPHAPHPHNLYGLVFKAKGDHRSAMNHFRAAWALDSTYKPAQHNLYIFGTFYTQGPWAYDETDCPAEDDKDACVIRRDENGIGRVVRSTPCAIEYDINGVGHVLRG